ncbi:nitroreductase [Aquirhabdus sp.]|uniref:nitroreductase family protein n=1 Tax=Aquirhabdus sp. TaxID=2824160 RepID=UPI00396CEE02
MKTQAETLFEMINARQSDGMLSAPAPSSHELQLAIQAALTAPDHHRLQPWRFLTVSGDARLKMGEVLRQALIARGETDETALNKVRGQPLRAPMILVCVVDTKEHPKVPLVEQVLSMGAAIQNILLMLKALGYGSMWRTGAITESPVLKAAFGLKEHDVIAGFVYIGSLSRDIAAREIPDVNHFLHEWI